MPRTPLAILGVSALLALAVPAFAQEAGPPPPPPERLLQMDANGDGQISRAEVDASIRTMFNSADTNRDARLTREEFTAHLAAQRAEHEANRPPRPENAPPAGERGHRRGPPEPGEAFARTDWNADGFVTLDEFVVQPRMHALRADRNGDGIIAGEELQPPRERRGRGRHG